MKRLHYPFPAGLCLVGLLFVSAASAARGESIEWVRQLGTSAEDQSRGVSADGLGNVYISGYTDGSLGGPTAGGFDAFVSKYDAAGTLQWTRQLGTSSTDYSYGVSADGLGNIYFSGYTQGSLGGPNAGGSDAFVVKIVDSVVPEPNTLLLVVAGLSLCIARCRRREYNNQNAVRANCCARRIRIALAISICSTASAARGESIEWVRQLGTSSSDTSYGLSADGLGNVYISGSTSGSLGGPNAGGSIDAFVSKYDAAGNFQWTQQLGTSAIDIRYGVSADGLGNVYIAGQTRGSLGGTNAGSDDAFVSKYDAASIIQWTQQLGTGATDQSFGVSADGLGNVYISGTTLGSLGGPSAGGNDAFVSKYDAAGNYPWTQQLGSGAFDVSFGVSTDGLGNVYISGLTGGSLGGPSAGGNDAFVIKYDAAGNFQWTQQLGTSATDFSYGVSADGLGNVYISGWTGGSLGGPFAGASYDAFVSKYDAAGIFQWTRQLGTGANDLSYSVSADGLGNVYISGRTDGSLGGPGSSGDAFLSKYDAAGNFQWTQQLGTSAIDFSHGVSADGLGNVYFSGYTSGSLGGPSAGVTDAFVAKIADPVVPEPSTLLLLGFGSLAVLWRRRGLVCASILAAVFTTSNADRARGESIEWVRQLGTSGQDDSDGVSADGLGNVYISGYTSGSLGGPNAGSSDGFVSKYDAAGTLQWSRQLGTSGADRSYGVSADGLGNVYISGFTTGSLGEPNVGGDDAFVSKYDAAGTLQWSRQLGTSGGDRSYGVSADGLGNVYISGGSSGSLGGPNAGSSDAFVSKYDAAGTLQWSRQLGTSLADQSNGVSADVLGNVYISGYTEGSLGGPNAGSPYDAFVSKYDAAGSLQWTRQLGTSSNDVSEGVSADGLGNVYISGGTNGSLGGPNAGNEDAFVSKYDAAGTLQWTRQLGTRSFDRSNGVSADVLGNVYISGITIGSLGGPTAGGNDAFVSKYDAAGTLQWTQQLGTSSTEQSFGVSADGIGGVYFSGFTRGSLGGPFAGGGDDTFVSKIADLAVPEPNTMLLSAMIGAVVVLSRRKCVA